MVIDAGSFNPGVTNNRTRLSDDFVKLLCNAFGLYIVGQLRSATEVVGLDKAVPEQLEANTLSQKLVERWIKIVLYLATALISPVRLRIMSDRPCSKDNGKVDCVSSSGRMFVD
jgi:hypothetical protein